MKLIQKIKNAYRLHEGPRYKIAAQMGFSASFLSQIVNEIIKIQDDDPRILKLAEILGVLPDTEDI